MSYTRSYSGSISVSGSVSASYPASESGGTHLVSYHENVPVTINMYVDTEPFDMSVANAGACINGLTGAVTAMEVAQCDAIRTNANKISSSLINGFYNMMKSDLTMKKSENSSQLQSKAALVFQLSKDIQDKHERMESDVARLRTHYKKIFDGLDEDMHNRIAKLDRYAFELDTNVRQNLLVGPYITVGAATADGVRESNKSLGMLSIARMRRKISDVLTSMTSSLRKSLTYKKTMEHILWTNGNNSSGYEYVPVIYTVSRNMGSYKFADEYIIPENLDKEKMNSGVSSFVRSVQSDKWTKIPDEDMKYISQAFMSMVEEDSKSIDASDHYKKRVYEEILKMWNRNRNEMTSINTY